MIYLLLVGVYLVLVLVCVRLLARVVSVVLVIVFLLAQLAGRYGLGAPVDAGGSALFDFAHWLSIAGAQTSG